MDVALAIEVGENTVSQWAMGRYVPNALVLDDLCVFLACSIDDIYPKQ